MKTFVTRNRRGQPPTTEFDVYDGNTNLGIGVKSYFVDGDFKVQFKGEESMVEARVFDDVKNELSGKVFFASTPDECLIGIKYMADTLFNLSKGSMPVNSQKSYTVEFNWQMGHEVINDIETVGLAKGYKELIEKQFSWAKISDFEVFEVQSVRKKL